MGSGPVVSATGRSESVLTGDGVILFWGVSRRLREGVEVDAFVERGEFLSDAERENLGGETGEYARIPRGMLGERFEKPLGHELRISRTLQAFLEKAQEIILRRGFENEPRADACAERDQFRSFQPLREPLVAGEDDGEKQLRVKLGAQEQP